MRILVIGGTLFIGRALTRALVAQGHDVTLLHRRPADGLPEGVAQAFADRNDAASITAAIDPGRFDVVFDNVYDWQRGTTGEQVRDTAQLFRNVSRYVFMSSVAAYGEGLHRTEASPLAPPHHPDPYVRNKANSERALFEMADRLRFPAVTLRPPFIYGPGNPFYREAFFWDRLRDHRPILVPGIGQRLMHFVYVDDLVDLAIRVMTQPQAVGQAYNAGNDAPVTQLGVVKALADAANLPLRHVFAGRRLLVGAGGSVMTPPFYFGEYFDLPPITVSNALAKTALGFLPTAFSQGLWETYRWYLTQPTRASSYEYEDRVLRILPQD